MNTVLILLVLLLIMVAAVLVILVKRDPAFKKEFGEFLLASYTSAKDLRLTDSEKALIKKEWEEIDWKSALRKLFDILKR